jgi:phosphatidylglycerophosphatase A
LKDPGFVVADELVGQWIGLGGCARLNWKGWCAAFILFQFFDVWKPPPARQLERVPGGAGIVLDDVAAGIYAALVSSAARWFKPF